MVEVEVGEPILVLSFKVSSKLNNLVLIFRNSGPYFGP